MITGGSDMKMKPEKTYAHLSQGDAVRIARELQEMSQSRLASLSGIPQSTISGIEKGRIALGIERAKRLARALKVHPAVLAFPDWQSESQTA
jgi:transcriptional regulator with XRE-family HTH domain